MRNLENELLKRTINYNNLIKHGFKKENDKYTYRTNILDNAFEVEIFISDEEKYSRLIDLENNNEYSLVDVEDATGEFIGKVRQEYEKVLNDIISKCTFKEAFKTKQAKEIIQYIKNKYNDDLEFLWEKFDDDAVWRNKQNNKWYGLLLTVSEKIFNKDSNKKIEIIDLRYQKEKIDEVIDDDIIFPGYHMNKKSWITIKLDESMDTKEIFELIDNSYNLSVGSKSGLVGDIASQKVLDYLRTIPKGKVVTYKQVAEFLGNKGLARVVGTILHKNPDGDKYPCYKVLNSKGELAEAFIFGGKDVQRERLEKDGIKVINNKVDLNIYQWKVHRYEQ